MNVAHLVHDVLRKFYEKRQNCQIALVSESFVFKKIQYYAILRAVPVRGKRKKIICKK